MLKEKSVEGSLRGEGFAGSYLPDFQAPPLSLPALGGPSNPKGTFGQTFSYTLPAWAW
jgi:hypothetical protein